MPWGDCTGPWWINSGANRGYGLGCCGREMPIGQGYAARQAFMPISYGIPHQPTPAEETSYLEETAKRLEEELRSIKERIEKLQSVA